MLGGIVFAIAMISLLLAFRFTRSPRGSGERYGAATSQGDVIGASGARGLLIPLFIGMVSLSTIYLSAHSSHPLARFLSHFLLIGMTCSFVAMAINDYTVYRKLKGSPQS